MNPGFIAQALNIPFEGRDDCDEDHSAVQAGPDCFLSEWLNSAITLQSE